MILARKNTEISITFHPQECSEEEKNRLINEYIRLEAEWQAKVAYRIVKEKYKLKQNNQLE